MESRSRWRKGESGVREGVAGLVDALREATGAEALALFDDDRAGPKPDPEPQPLSLWDAFAELPCVDLDWTMPYATLRATERFETTCSCAARHRICGFLVHRRWVLILVAPQVPAPGAAAALASGLAALADRLPPAQPDAQERGDEWYREPSRARKTGAMPAWWIRRAKE